MDVRRVPSHLRGELLTLQGDRIQHRSFCYVDDMIEGIRKLMDIEVHEPINLGNPEEWTIVELAQQIIELTQSRSQIVFQTLPQDDPKQRCPDITRARQLPGWQPRVSLQQGLKQTIAWFAKGLGRTAQVGAGSQGITLR